MCGSKIHSLLEGVIIPCCSIVLTALLMGSWSRGERRRGAALIGQALHVGIMWWIRKRTERGFAFVVDSEGKVARSLQTSWMRSVGDTRYCVLLM